MIAATGRTTWRALLAEAEEKLDRLDARRVVERASGRDGAELFAALDEEAPARAVPFLRDMVARRVAGEPLQYVLGRWGFRKLDLMVDRRVLIPRPETETVVEVALAELDRLGPHPLVVDLGTGSGAIAISMAVECETATVWATDRSADALAVAGANLAGAGRAAARVRLAEGSWFDALPDHLRGNVDLVVSNPPYVADDEDLPADVADWEPASALRAGPSGLEDVARIVAAAPDWLTRPGALVVEIAPHQAEAARRLTVDAGFFEADVDVRADLAGRPRTLVARR